MARNGPRWGVLVAWASVLGLLALLGFGLFRAQEGPVRVGARAPDFEVTTFGGETWRTADLRGRVVVVNFWASWCQPCEEEAALLEQAFRQYREAGVVFLGINYVDIQPEALAYIERFGITYPNGPDLGTRIAQAFRIRGVPETFVVSADGVLTSVKVGPFSQLAELQRAIEGALAGGG